MKPDDFNELKLLICGTMDEVTFLDMLGLTIEDLVDRFEDEIEENYTRLLDACR